MYADYEFYSGTFGGTMSENDWNVYGLRASDFLDVMTRRHLRGNSPSNTDDLRMVKTAVCVLADAHKAIADRQTELAGSVSGGGTVKSVSSGGESLSFELSAIDKAISGGQAELNRYYYEMAKVYLSGVADDEGRYYLYWGLV